MELTDKVEKKIISQIQIFSLSFIQFTEVRTRFDVQLRLWVDLIGWI